MDDGGKQIYRFGDIQIDARFYIITRHGAEQHLRQRSFEVLLYLLQNRDRVVNKEELIQNIWKVTAVTDDALVQSIVEIRKALGDDPRRPRH